MLVEVKSVFFDEAVQIAVHKRNFLQSNGNLGALADRTGNWNS